MFCNYFLNASLPRRGEASHRLLNKYRRNRLIALFTTRLDHYIVVGTL